MQWIVLAAVLGLLVGFWAGRRTEKNRILDQNYIGDLRVDHSDPDGPYLFLEIDPRAARFTEKEIVTLKVVHKDFVPQK